MNQVKVSGLITPQQHGEMARIAAESKSTIGAIVEFAIVRTLKDMARNKSLAAKLRRDSRSTRKEQ